MRRLGRLLVKDVRLLVRSPALVAMLVVYPLLVAALAAVALKGGEASPRIAVVNLDTPGLSVDVGGTRLTVDDYVARMRDDVDVRTLSPESARDALDAGDVQAVLTVPNGFMAALQSGVQQPTLLLQTNPRSPVEGAAVERRLEAAVYRFNQGLAVQYVEQVVRLADLITNGGSLGVFGRSIDVIGLVRSGDLIRELQAQARAQGNPGLAARMDPLLVFIRQTQANLNLVRPAATSIASPILLKTEGAATGRQPMSAFGVAAALLVSVALAGVLLGAAGIASEREDLTLQRLRLGGVPVWMVVAVKMVLAAVVCVVLGLLLLGVVALATDLPVGRWALWVAALALAGAACAGVGTCLGALVPDARAALVGGLLVSLPLVFVGMVPGQAARAVAGVLPFGRAFDAFQTLLGAPDVTGLAVHLALLAVMAAVLTAVSARLLRLHGDA